MLMALDREHRLVYVIDTVFGLDSRQAGAVAGQGAAPWVCRHLLGFDDEHGRDHEHDCVRPTIYGQDLWHTRLRRFASCKIFRRHVVTTKALVQPSGA